MKAIITICTSILIGIFVASLFDRDGSGKMTVTSFCFAGLAVFVSVIVIRSVYILFDKPRDQNNTPDDV